MRISDSSFIASMELPMILKKTCFNCSESPLIKGSLTPASIEILIFFALNSSFFNRTVSSIIERRLIFLKFGSWGRIAFKKCAIIPSSRSTSFIQVSKDFLNFKKSVS